MRTFSTLDEVADAIGEELGTGDWLEITQDRVNTFADATDDHQWIHVDVERAEAGPFGGPIAHGYLTLSLTNLFLPQVVEVRGVSMGVNRGTGKVRFPAPVPVGSRLRAGVELLAVDDVAGGDRVLDRGDDHPRAEALDPRVTRRQHLVEVEAGVDLEERERQLGREERLLRETEHDDRVLAAREQQDGSLELGRHLADDVDGLGLERHQVAELVGGEGRGGRRGA